MDATDGIATGAVVDVRLPDSAGGVQGPERSTSQGVDGEVATTQMVIHVPLLGGARQLTRDLEEPLGKSLGRLRVTLDKATKGPRQRKKKTAKNNPADSAAVVQPPPLRCLLYLRLLAPLHCVGCRSGSGKASRLHGEHLRGLLWRRTCQTPPPHTHMAWGAVGGSLAAMHTPPAYHFHGHKQSP
jgi:hypothetical protein